MEPEAFYHIYNRGNNHEDIFRDGENYRFFLHRYKNYVDRYIDTYAYCLMPNHFHFLIRVKDLEVNCTKSEDCKLTPLEKAFRDFFISYAKSFNKRYHRTGSLFQYKFKRKLISKDSHLMYLVIYIHRNLVKAGLCTTEADWAHSSYRAMISTEPTTLQRDAVLDWFGGRESFIEAHETEIEEKDYRNIIGY